MPGPGAGFGARHLFRSARPMRTPPTRPLRLTPPILSVSARNPPRSSKRPSILRVTGRHGFRSSIEGATLRRPEHFENRRIPDDGGRVSRLIQRIADCRGNPVGLRSWTFGCRYFDRLLMGRLRGYSPPRVRSSWVERLPNRFGSVDLNQSGGRRSALGSDRYPIGAPTPLAGGETRRTSSDRRGKRRTGVSRFLHAKAFASGKGEASRPGAYRL